MEFAKQIFSDMQSNSDFLNFIGILLTALISVYIFKKESSTAFIRERHDKLFSPLFHLLEPALFREIPKDSLQHALKIIEENKNIADGKLLEIFYVCSNSPTQQAFNQLCTYVNRMYDRSCWKLGLKLRSITYRISRRQYRYKITLFFSIALYTLFSFIIASIIFFTFLFTIAVLSSLIHATIYATNPIGTLLALSFLALIFISFIDKHL